MSYSIYEKDINLVSRYSSYEYDLNLYIWFVGINPSLVFIMDSSEEIANILVSSTFHEKKPQILVFHSMFKKKENEARL